MISSLSKSEKKRRAKGIEQLVHELVMLPDMEINQLPCSREIRDEILTAKGLKGGSKKRQLKYATKLLRDKPLEDLFDFLSSKKGVLLKKNREFQELEHFRNLLINEAILIYEEKMFDSGYMNESDPGDLIFAEKTVEEITEQLPSIDWEPLRNSAMQFARTRNRKYSREMFRILRAAYEKKQFSQKQDRNDGI